jgi:hypothetical protein
VKLKAEKVLLDGELVEAAYEVLSNEHCRVCITGDECNGFECRKGFEKALNFYLLKEAAIRERMAALKGKEVKL